MSALPTFLQSEGPYEVVATSPKWDQPVGYGHFHRYQDALAKAEALSEETRHFKTPITYEVMVHMKMAA